MAITRLGGFLLLSRLSDWIASPPPCAAILANSERKVGKVLVFMLNQ